MAVTSRAPLSRERVLSAAMRLADSGGLAAVTMRKVAADLDVEAMSLYHHLPGKDGLLDGLVESIVAEIQTEVAMLLPADDWRADVRGRALAARRVMVRHPWAPVLIGARPSVPTAVFGYFEQIVAAMVRGGVGYHLAHQGLHSLGSMLMGFAQEVFNPAAAGGTIEEDATQEEMARLAEQIPHLIAMAATEAHAATDPTLGWCDSQTEFEFTLDLLLEGLDRARRAAEAAQPRRPRDTRSSGPGAS
ncbi:MAG TPA: TetR/AcrR family transcriptional regulator C-terminal domain-containing protein [Propionicimonas sp.]|jgi:AcrR family transcriptional regulator